MGNAKRVEGLMREAAERGDRAIVMTPANIARLRAARRDGWHQCDRCLEFGDLALFSATLDDPVIAACVACRTLGVESFRAGL